MVNFFRSDAILIFFGYTLPLLLMRLFGLNHHCWSFSIFWFSRILIGFHDPPGFFGGFSWFFLFLKFTIVNDVICFAEPSGLMFLRCLRFIDHHMRLFLMWCLRWIFQVYLKVILRRFLVICTKAIMDNLFVRPWLIRLQKWTNFSEENNSSFL